VIRSKEKASDDYYWMENPGEGATAAHGRKKNVQHAKVIIKHRLSQLNELIEASR